MSTRETTIGILGAYGNLGSNAARELAAHSGLRLLLGGRNRASLDAFAGTLNHHGDTMVVDVHDSASAAKFCGECDVVVNCSRYSDVLTEAVFDAGCHLVDTTAFRTERWKDREAALSSTGRTWLTYVGWIPGLPDVVAAYLEAEAMRRFGKASSVDVYVYDCNEYLGYGLMDLVGGLFYGPGVLDKVQALWGKSKAAAPKPPPEQELDRLRPTPKLSVAKLPKPIGRKLVVTDTPNARRRIFLAYEPAVLKPLLASFWYGTTRTEEWLAQNVVGPAFRRRVEKNGVAEVVFGRARGENGQSVEVSFIETQRDGYWLSGVIPATAARLIVEGKITTTGITKLDLAVDAMVLAEELSRVGVDFRAKS